MPQTGRLAPKQGASRREAPNSIPSDEVPATKTRGSSSRRGSSPREATRSSEASDGRWMSTRAKLRARRGGRAPSAPPGLAGRRGTVTDPDRRSGGQSLRPAPCPLVQGQPQAQTGPVLGLRGDPQLDPRPSGRRHLDLPAQQRASQRHLDLDHQVLAMTVEGGVLADAYPRPETGGAEHDAVVDAGRNPQLEAAAVGEFDLPRGPDVGLTQAHLHLPLRVRGGDRARPPPESEEGPEQVRETAPGTATEAREAALGPDPAPRAATTGAGGGARTPHTRVDSGDDALPGVAEAVVERALLRIGEHVVGLRDLLEASFRLPVTGVEVGVVAPREPSEGTVDLVSGGGAREAEERVVVPGRRHRHLHTSSPRGEPPVATPPPPRLAPWPRGAGQRSGYTRARTRSPISRRPNDGTGRSRRWRMTWSQHHSNQLGPRSSRRRASAPSTMYTAPGLKSSFPPTTWTRARWVWPYTITSASGKRRHSQPWMPASGHARPRLRVPSRVTGSSISRLRLPWTTAIVRPSTDSSRPGGRWGRWRS